MNNNSSYIPNKGDYVEGIEHINIGGQSQYRIMRGWVDKISLNKVFIQADDCYNGNRGTMINLNSVRRIFVRVPKWWMTKNRKIKPNTVVKYFNNDLYKVIGYATDVSDETLHEVVMYYRIDNPDKVYIRDAIEFNSVVDKANYPNIDQVYRFEEIKD